MSMSLMFRKPLRNYIAGLQSDHQRIINRAEQAKAQQAAERDKAQRTHETGSAKAFAKRIWHITSPWIVAALIATVIVMDGALDIAVKEVRDVSTVNAQLRNICGKPTRLILAGAPADVARDARQIADEIDRDQTTAIAQRASAGNAQKAR